MNDLYPNADVDEIVAKAKKSSVGKFWKQYKKEQFNFKYKSSISEQAALMKLSKISNTDAQAIAIIMQSIENGWKGLFEIKTHGKSTNQQSRLSDQQIEYLAARKDI